MYNRDLDLPSLHSILNIFKTKKYPKNNLIQGRLLVICWARNSRVSDGHGHDQILEYGQPRHGLIFKFEHGAMSWPIRPHSDPPIPPLNCKNGVSGNMVHCAIPLYVARVVNNRTIDFGVRTALRTVRNF